MLPIVADQGLKHSKQQTDATQCEEHGEQHILPAHRCCTHAMQISQTHSSFRAHCVLQADAELHKEEEEQRYLSCTPLPAPSDAHGLAAFLAAARPDPALCTPAAVLASCQVPMYVCIQYRPRPNHCLPAALLASCQVKPGLLHTVVTLNNDTERATVLSAGNARTLRDMG